MPLSSLNLPPIEIEDKVRIEFNNKKIDTKVLEKTRTETGVIYTVKEKTGRRRRLESTIHEVTLDDIPIDQINVMGS